MARSAKIFAVFTLKLPKSRIVERNSREMRRENLTFPLKSDFFTLNLTILGHILKKSQII